MGPDPENRVGDQDTGSPCRPVSSGLQVLRETVLVVPMVDSYKLGHYDVRENGDTAPHILNLHGDTRECPSPNPVALQSYKHSSVPSG